MLNRTFNYCFRKISLTFFTLIISTHSFKVLGSSENSVEWKSHEPKEFSCEKELDFKDLEECQAEALLENRDPEECTSFYWAKSASSEEYDSEKIVKECSSKAYFQNEALTTE